MYPLRKILISYHNFPPIAADLSVAFQHAGIQTRLFITDDNEHWFYRRVIKPVNKLARRLRLIGREDDLFANHPCNQLNWWTMCFQSQCDDFQPDLIFVIHGIPFAERYLSTLTVPKIAWWIEPNDDILYLRQFSKPFNLYTSFSSKAVQLLKDFDVETAYLHHAVSPDRFYPLAHIPQIYDIAFVGNFSPERDAALQAVLAVTKNVALYGPGWKKRSRLAKSDLRSIYKGERIVGESLNALFNSSRVILNVQRLTERNGLNMRYFEVLAARACLLTDTVPEIRQHFIPDKHLCIFDGIDDLKKKLNNLLSNETMRETIRYHGHKHVLDNYTYKHQVATLLSFHERIIGHCGLDDENIHVESPFPHLRIR